MCTCTPMFIAANTEKIVTPQCPSTDEFICKMGYIFEYYSTLKRHGILTHATTQMNPESEMNEISQWQKDKHCLSPLI